MKSVKDLMLPLSEYAVVREDATLADALKALEEAQVNLPPGRHPHRAVLVVNPEGRIVGKLGHHGFLQALEPKYALLGNVENLARVGLSSEFIDSMVDNYRFWQDDLSDVCERARTIRIRDVMKPAEESIDENASLTEAIHRLVMWGTLSILVTRRGKVVGILRMSDLFSEIAESVRSSGR